MKLKQIEQCHIFDFTPYKPGGALPFPMVYEQWVFGGVHACTQAIDLGKSLEEVLFLTFPELPFVDLLRLSSRLQKHDLACDFEKLFSFYNLKWNEETKDLLQDFEVLPESFLKWATLKDFHFTEFKLISWGLKNSKNFLDILNKITELNPSRQTAAKILEYYLDISSSDHLLAQILQMPTTDKIYEFLYGQRFPETSKKDLEQQSKTQKFPWPAHVKAQWVRQGDKAGIEIRLSGASADDLKKKISALHELKEKFENQIWN